VKTTGHKLLEVTDLRVHVHTRDGTVRAVDGASFHVGRGEALGIVGESGSGKSMTCSAIVQVHPKPAAVIEGGRVLFDGENLLEKSPGEMRRIRGERIGMILQDPLNSLNPVTTIGHQLMEPMRLSHPDLSRARLRERAVEALGNVGIPDPTQRLGAFPFEFSGGMRQRVAAAIAISRDPELLIADEPTTALDVTTQARFIELLKKLKRERNMGLLLVTHDLGVVAGICERVAVMYGGRVVETGTMEQITRAPRHPYTLALLRAVPSLHGPRQRRLYQIAGEPPNNRLEAPGCHFAPRCERADERCRREYPGTAVFDDGSQVACWRSIPGHEEAGND
jgi:oligopeptide/dipeptide ABC transporter ATP-binding protein